MKSKLKSIDTQTIIKIKVTPKSSKNKFVGKEGDIYKVKISSPPVQGKANKALILFLSKTLDIPKKNLEIVSGERGRLKTIRVRGYSKDDICSRIMKVL